MDSQIRGDRLRQNKGRGVLRTADCEETSLGKKDGRYTALNVGKMGAPQGNDGFSYLSLLFNNCDFGKRGAPQSPFLGTIERVVVGYGKEILVEEREVQFLGGGDQNHGVLAIGEKCFRLQMIQLPTHQFEIGHESKHLRQVKPEIGILNT